MQTIFTTTVTDKTDTTSACQRMMDFNGFFILNTAMLTIMAAARMIPSTVKYVDKVLSVARISPVVNTTDRLAR